MTDHGRHQIKARIQAAGHSPARNDPQPAEAERGTTSIRLPPLDALLPRIAALAGDGLPPTIGPLRQHKRILLDLFAEVEASIVDDVILLHDVRLLEIAAAGGFLADDLELGVGVRMGGGGHALEDAGFGEEEGSGADGEEGTFFARVCLLEGAEVFDEFDGFGVFVVQDGFDTFAAGDDEDVVFSEGFVGVVVVHVGFDDEAGGGGGAWLGRDVGAFEGFGGWRFFKGGRSVR